MIRAALGIFRRFGRHAVRPGAATQSIGTYQRAIELAERTRRPAAIGQMYVTIGDAD